MPRAPREGSAFDSAVRCTVPVQIPREDHACAPPGRVQGRPVPRAGGGAHAPEGGYRFGGVALERGDAA